MLQRQPVKIFLLELLYDNHPFVMGCPFGCPLSQAWIGKFVNCANSNGFTALALARKNTHGAIAARIGDALEERQRSIGRPMEGVAPPARAAAVSTGVIHMTTG